MNYQKYYWLGLVGSSYKEEKLIILLVRRYRGGVSGFPETPSISNFLLIVHQTFLNQWMVKTYYYHQR